MASGFSRILLRFLLMNDSVDSGGKYKINKYFLVYKQMISKESKIY